MARFIFISIMIVMSLFCVSCFPGKKENKQKKNLIEYPTNYNLIIKNKGGIDLDLSYLEESGYCASNVVNYVDKVNEFDSENKDQFVKLTLLSTTNDSIRYTIEFFKIRGLEDTLRTTNGGTFKRNNNCEEIAKTLCLMINK